MIVDYKPQTITDRVSLDDVKYGCDIDKLQSAKAALKKRGCDNIKLSIETEKEWNYDSEYIHLTVEVVGRRAETEKELAARVKCNESREAQFKKDEREQYERLKNIYEKK